MGRPRSATDAVTSSASRVTLAAMSAGSVRSWAKVTSRLRDRGTRGSSTTGESPPPRPSNRRWGPIVGPNRRASSWWSAAASSATVVMPSSPRRALIRVPMPLMAVTGSDPITGSHVPRVRRATPPGFAKPVAVLAWSFVSPIPTAQCRCVAASTVAWRRRAKASGSAVRTPTHASSQPHSSTGTSSDRSAAITRSDAAS